MTGFEISSGDGEKQARGKEKPGNDQTKQRRMKNSIIADLKAAR
jgi:hypothetical protein